MINIEKFIKELVETLNTFKTDEEASDYLNEKLKELDIEDRKAVLLELKDMFELEFEDDEIEEGVEEIEIDKREEAEVDGDEEMKVLRIKEKNLEVSASEISFQEEVARIEKINNNLPKFDTDLKDNEVYEFTTERTVSFLASMRMLLDNGIDYQTAVSLANSFITSHDNLKQQQLVALGNERNGI